MRMNEQMPNVCERYLFYSLLISLFSCYYLEEKKKLKHFQMLDDMASFISLSIQKCTEKPEIDAKRCMRICLYVHASQTKTQCVLSNENKNRFLWFCITLGK